MLKVKNIISINLSEFLRHSIQDSNSSGDYWVASFIARRILRHFNNFSYDGLRHLRHLGDFT